MVNKTEKEILKKIKTGEVKMKPRWWFVATFWGIKAIYWLMVLGAGFGAAMLYYFLDLYRPNEWSIWWELGPELILEDFPIMGAIGFVLCLIAGVIIVSRIGENYRQKNKFWLLTVIMVLMVGVFFYLLKIGV